MSLRVWSASALLVALVAGGPAPARGAAPGEPPVVVALDTSRSLRQEDLAASADLVGRVLGELPAGVPSGLIAFDDEARWVVPVGAAVREVAAALGTLAPTGNVTVLHDALFLAARALPEGGVVLLVTDGRDEGSATTVDDVARLAERHGVRILALSAGRGVEERALRRFALLTGGRYLGRPGPGEVAGAVREAREELARAPAPRRPATAQAPQGPDQAPPAGAPPATDAATASPEEPQEATTPVPATTAAAVPSSPRPFWWVLVPLALVLVAAVGLWAARRRPRPSSHYCERCGSELAAADEPCRHCRDDELRARVSALPVAQLEDTAELAITTPVPLPAAGEPGMLEVTRVLSEQHVVVVREPERPPRTYLLRAESAFGVGRDPAGNTLALADPALSARHLRIVPDEGRFFVLDLGSTNGTLHNGERVDLARLRSGDVVRAGQTELEYRIMTQALG